MTIEQRILTYIDYLLVMDEEVSDLQMRVATDRGVMTETERHFNGVLTEIYEIVHAHLPTSCHQTHQDWRDMFLKREEEMLKECAASNDAGNK